jgi:tetratricopeptide (TPR) repeat protein
MISPMLPIATFVLGLTLQAAASGLGDAYFFFVQGRMLEGRGDVAGAIVAYQKAADLAPTSAAIHSELAGVYARAGRAADSLREAQAALTLDPAEKEAHRIYGLVQAAMSEDVPAGPRQVQMMNEAIGHLEKSLLNGARDPNAELTLGRLALRTDSLPKAIQTLRAFLFDNPGYAEAVTMLAEALERSGKVSEAIDTLAPFVATAAAPASARAWLAELYERVNRWAEAAQLWRARAKENPRDIEVLYAVAQSERRAGNAAAVEAAAKQISAIDPADPRGPLAMAEAREAALDFAGVITVLQPLYEARRGTARAKEDTILAFVAMSLANAYETTRQFDRAEQILRESISRNSSDAGALNYLGYLLADRGQKLDDAVSLVKRALVIDPGNPSYLDSLGWAYFRQGKSADALAPLEEAARAVSTGSAIQDHLGDVYFSLKRYREAADTWTRALAGDRDGIDLAVVTKKRDRARELAK